MKWLFSSGSYLKVYDDHKEAWFSICDLRIKVAWTEGEFTPADWDKTLACVKEAKKILRRIKMI